MANDIFADAKRQLNIQEVVQRYAGVQFKRNKGLCPLHQEKTPSFTIYPGTNTFKCYGCGAMGDCVGFVAKLRGLNQIDALKLLNADFELRLAFDDKVSVKPQLKDFKPYLEQCKAAVGKTDYLIKRGFSAETIKRFGLGYDEQKKQVTVPYNRKMTYYQTRSIYDKKFFKPKTEEAGSEPIYNEDILSERDNREPIFVVESQFCAISIMQSGARAVATCGGSGVSKFAEKLKKLKSKPKFIIAFDNDEPGRTATKELASLFTKEKVKHISYSVSGGEKDPNDLLQKNPEELRANIEKAREQFFRHTTSFCELIPLTDIMATKFPLRNWLIKGLMSQGLYMLFAAPKMGKSFMALDMCLSIASGSQFLGFNTTKQSVWYMAMEDTPQSIQERCNILWRGKPIPENMFVTHNDQYKIKRNGNDLDEDSLIAHIENTLFVRPDIKFIVIDTLQLVRGDETKGENAYKGDYKDLRIPKRFVDERGIAIMFIHHARKSKDENNEFNEVSGSNAITGCMDAVFRISKKKANDSEAVFSVLARSIYQEDLAIHFDRNNCQWVRIGTGKEQAEQRAKEQYFQNEFRKTIVHLLELGGGNWHGTMTDLLNECGKLHGHSPAIVRPTQISQEIGRLEPMLLLHDNIGHAPPNKHGGKQGRRHYFYYKHKEMKQQALTV